MDTTNTSTPLSATLRPVVVMNPTWGVYKVKGRLTGGAETDATDRKAVSYYVRWRVNGKMHRRSFETRGHAKTFREKLIAAKALGWEADERGWPIDPSSASVAAPPAPATPTLPAVVHTVESYIDQVWWPTIRTNLSDKNRVGHRGNADVAIRLLRLADQDPRVFAGIGNAGDSIRLIDLTSDDVRAALVARGSINGRTAAANARRLKRAIEADDGSGVLDVHLEPEQASDATVRSFYITLGMIMKAADASGQVIRDPMVGTARFAPKPKVLSMSQRLVPSLDELFDLADAISQCGPLMDDGRPRGARLRSLILTGGTTGPRPGELVAHRPDWFEFHEAASEIVFRKTEGPVYGKEIARNERGRRERPLKRRDEEAYRSVPMVPDVLAAILEHIERGYSSDDRTWLSPTGRAHLDWGNITTDYWKPAMRAVFGGTAKASLVNESPKILRKTAITWWRESGITENLAAEWAGHSEDVARIYYASRSETTYKREVTLLTQTMTNSRFLNSADATGHLNR